jgi:hypothetical protein
MTALGKSKPVATLCEIGHMPGDRGHLLNRGPQGWTLDPTHEEDPDDRS